MELKNQRRLAASVLKCSEKKVYFSPESLDEIKEAITKADIKSLINQKIILIKRGNHLSRSRARKKLRQKRKGGRKGAGSRKGRKFARLPKKEVWMIKIRAQRELLKKLRDKEMIDKKTYQNLYLKAKGGFFRNKRHIKLYLEEYNLIKK
ncbi:50S ribosomal protein L19e [Candidatus Woesearchaeota archaeon]|nr:50S ribosomal protein L19e [Candidatus Woesearchaeota archaeon]